MKYCSKCTYCVMDCKALTLGVVIDKCLKKGHLILHPFFRGWRCKEYKKEQT